MNEEISTIKSRVLGKIKPTREEKEELLRIVEMVKARILEAARAHGMSVRVEIEGSVAKDTWISTDRDVDIFIIFPHGTDKETITSIGLDLAKAGAGERWKTGYAEHPYVEAEVLGCKMDIVPSGEMLAGKKAMTAVDRTPLHTRYVLSKLGEADRDEVRVLKQFMKGIGVYGAELKVGGFSGYLCELLIVKYSRFEQVLKEAANWRGRVLIDLEGAYNPKDALEAFPSPLVVIDPVDRSRNAAAAVTRRAFSTFITASRHFLKEPTMAFFFPPDEDVPEEELRAMILNRGSEVLGIKTRCPHLPSDVLWGEIKHSLSKIEGLLEQEGFLVLDSGAWSDEKENIYFLIELQSGKLPAAVLRIGPSVEYPEDERRFLEKHAFSEKTVAGPFIVEDRWCVLKRRESTSAAELLLSKMPKIGLSPDVAAEIRRGFKLLLPNDLVEDAIKEPPFRGELLRFLRKRPQWLQKRS